MNSGCQPTIRSAGFVPVGAMWILMTVLLSACTGHESVPAEYSWPVTEYVFAQEAVAAAHPLASQAGLQVLEQGGNAVDAAVATSFCLSVVRPYSCGIGGGGFMLIYEPASGDRPPRSIALNYRETAPASVSRDHYQNLPRGSSQFGWHASGIPGTVAGLLYALEEYGTLDRAAVLAPAILAAETGFPADCDILSAIGEIRNQREKHPQFAPFFDEVLAVYDPAGTLQEGDLIRNPQQALALRLIAEQGAAAFYEGPIADAIASSMEAGGGTITRDDLRRFRIDVVEPLHGRFRDMDILAMPPPSSGGLAMLQVFGMLERRLDEVRMLPVNSAAYVHMIAEMMKHAFADRAQWLADPRFVDVPVERLLSDDYLDRRAWSISRTWTSQPQGYGTRQPPANNSRRAWPPDDHGTSHFSVIDRNGMAVACTETINLEFGSCVIVPGFGFTLNNEMDDFTTASGQPNEFGLIQSDRNAPEPGKRPLSSMSPTIVLEGGRAIAVAGASGGPRIISATLQSLVDVLLYDMTAGEALARPRFHHQWMPHVLVVEDEWPDASALQALRSFGHVIEFRQDSIGNVQVIVVRSDAVHAASDPRSIGRPAGR